MPQLYSLVWKSRTDDKDTSLPSLRIRFVIVAWNVQGYLARFGRWNGISMWMAGRWTCEMRKLIGQVYQSLLELTCDNRQDLDYLAE